MSRYAAISKDSRYSVTVGWDNPLQTFFATLIPVDESIDVVFLAGSDDDCLTVEELVERTKDHLEIPEHVVERLRMDEQTKRPPSALQVNVKNFFKR
jgi:hypothetical protein